jgi:hydroxyacylglutathione hydrolase
MLGTTAFSRTLWGITTAFASTGGRSSCSALRIPSLTAALTVIRMASSTVDSATSRCSFEVVQIPCLSDNYGYLIHNPVTGETAAIDTPDAEPYQRELQQRGWTLTHILNTHHHHDHTGGNMALKTKGVRIYGPASEQIPGRDVALQGGDEIEFGSAKAQILDVGGHTKGHIAYYFPDDAKVFVGDSLFALGCGRMFEGTPEQFWASLLRLRQLPDETHVYWYVCWLTIEEVLFSLTHAFVIDISSAHEYTLSNAKFAASIEPGNEELLARVTAVQEARRQGFPTVPSLLGLEKRTNPFLRCDVSEEIRAQVGATATDSDADVFGKVRRAKDRF